MKMSTSEIISVIVCLIIGYTIVGAVLQYFNKKSSRNDHSSDTNSQSRENGYRNSGQHSDNTSETSNQGRQSTDNKAGPEASQEYQNTGTNEQYDSSDSVSWFAILGVSQSSTKEEITTAYKRKIREYHPDKVASMGEDIRKLAEFKSKQINTAYDYVMKKG